jgi:uncharacterized coiled-coil protein SlyX
MCSPTLLSTSIGIGSNLIGRSPLRRSRFLVWLALIPLALSQPAGAVTPAPDGGYPGSNTAEGTDALFNLTIGTNNTAVGFNALFSNTSGSRNTAVGDRALRNNDVGGDNTAVGVFALSANTRGSDNVAIGRNALLSNQTGLDNTAVGVFALESNVGGNFNTAHGFSALLSNSTGSGNTATGAGALQSNQSGVNNTAVGLDTMFNNTIGRDNTAVGTGALDNNVSGSSNIALGKDAGSNLTSESNDICIGGLGVAGESNTIRIGRSGVQKSAFIQGIFGLTVPNGVRVVTNSAGKLGTIVSSARFKEAIKPMDKSSEAIFALQPVTFRYKHEFDPDGIPQFGLVAEEVAKVNADLVVRDQDGKVSTVRYDAIESMLLNEFLKEHRTVQEQKNTISQLKSAIAHQQKQIEALTAGLQKVSEQMEANKSAPQLVTNGY